MAASGATAAPGPELVEVSRGMVARRFVVWLVAVLTTVGIASAIGLLLTEAFDGSAVVRLDERIASRLASGRTGTGDTLTGIGNVFADPIPVAVLWFVAMVVAWRVFRTWAAPLVVLSGVGGEKLSYYLSTLIVDRPRPDVPTIGHRHVTSSFPSGHVGSAISLYGCIALLVWLYLWRRHRAGGATGLRPDRWLPAMAVVVALIGIVVAVSRMYRGFHFLTDVIAGALIGVTWVLVPALLLVRRGDGRAGAS